MQPADRLQQPLPPDSATAQPVSSPHVVARGDQHRRQDFLSDRQSYGALLGRDAHPPSDQTLKSLDLAAAVIATIMALGPLTVFAIYGGVGYSL